MMKASVRVIMTCKLRTCSPPALLAWPQLSLSWARGAILLERMSFTCPSSSKHLSTLHRLALRNKSQNLTSRGISAWPSHMTLPPLLRCHRRYCHLQVIASFESVYMMWLSDTFGARFSTLLINKDALMCSFLRKLQNRERLR